jgi:hypothetical protein
MRVPNVNIVLRSEKRHASVKTQPAWYADMYRKVWAGRLDAEKGIEIVPIDPDSHVSARYTDYDNVGEAERMTVAYFAHGDAKRTADVGAMFNAAFPDGLRPIIEKLLREDLAVTRERMAAAANAPRAHPSFLAAGLSVEHALALQKVGYATVNEVETDNLIKLGECGLNAEDMTKLMIAQAPVEPIAAANPLTTSAAKG